jgi:chromosomal replication initiation ATPase DnaA
MTSDDKFRIIVQTVCQHFNVPRDVLMGPRTSQIISRARHMSMALCDVFLPEWTTITIGARHNRKSGHSITLYARKKVHGHAIQAEVFRDLADALEAKGLLR